MGKILGNEQLDRGLFEKGLGKEQFTENTNEQAEKDLFEKSLINAQLDRDVLEKSLDSDQINKGLFEKSPDGGQTDKGFDLNESEVPENISYQVDEDLSNKDLFGNTLENDQVHKDIFGASLYNEQLDRDLFEKSLGDRKGGMQDILDESVLESFDKRIKELQEKEFSFIPEEEQKVTKKFRSSSIKEFEVEEYVPEVHGPITIFEGYPGYEEVERYWVDEPYAFVVILYNKNDDDNQYQLVEPDLSPFELKFLSEIKRRLQDVLVGLTEVSEDKDKLLKRKVNQIMIDYSIHLETLPYHKIMYYILRDYVEIGRITALMKDSLIEDISCNGWNSPIFLYHKNYTNIQTNVIFDEKELSAFIIRLAQKSGKHISVAEPMVDACMPNGSRIQMTLGDEITTAGSTFTIRRFKDIPITPVDLLRWNTFSSEQMAYLWMCIENNKSLIFSGGTASGKTSSLNAVSLFIPHKAKIISLEDTRELKLPHPNWIPGVTRDAFTADGAGAISMYELLRAALRQRPEFLLVGEVRGKEALTLFQAMSTGHTTFSTMHADSVDRVIHRLENPPISVPRSMIEALDIVSIQAQTFSNGKRVRRNMALVEITDIDPSTKMLKSVEVFRWEPSTDSYPNVGMSKALEDIRIRRAWSMQELKVQLKNRQLVLEYMLESNITKFEDIATIIYAFQANPQKILEKIGVSQEKKG